MSTDYTHFTNLAFTNLFARGPDQKEVQIINSNGAFVGTVVTTGSISVSKILVNSGSLGVPSISRTGDTDTGIFFPSANQLAVSAGNTQPALFTSAYTEFLFPIRLPSGSVSAASAVFSADVTTGIYRPASKQLGIAANGTNIVTVTTAALLVAKTLTVTGNATAANLSGTNTGDNVNASSSTAGLVSTGSQSFAGTKTFVTPLTGTNVASASSSASGVITTGTQSFAGIKTFATSAKFLTTGGTATALDYYEEGSFTCNFNAGAGSGGSGTSFTAHFTRIGKIVAIQFPKMNSMTSGTANASFQTSAGVLVSRLRPISSGGHWQNCEILIAATTTGTGVCNIGTDGSIVIYKNSDTTTQWAGSTASQGPYSFCAVYTIQ